MMAVFVHHEVPKHGHTRWPCLGTSRMARTANREVCVASLSHKGGHTNTDINTSRPTGLLHQSVATLASRDSQTYLSLLMVLSAAGRTALTTLQIMDTTYILLMYVVSYICTMCKILFGD